MSKEYFEYLKTEEKVHNDDFHIKKTHKVISDMMILLINS